MSVYKVIELIGTSEKSWEDAAQQAVAKARSSLRELRIVEVNKLDIKLDDQGNIAAYRARLNVSFKYDN
ncbi:dodecin family protein [Ectothiorhodospira sp. BSL-9]|uniref:dodecin family protein n=1 Tax=Ectothiorhodospira sp. BSL-9 TaxID=1442136 RepID=UPI0007B4518C|nr:dodecin family protein [Ectothiorhodospira sp. BSL-9]ANB03099.1 transporter [Ectothiorhodospira sp. BSL-9]TVQ73817.1 MAG: dodecin domain-containing protein [Chromatiaceae bacterium]